MLRPSPPPPHLIRNTSQLKPVSITEIDTGASISLINYETFAKLYGNKATQGKSLNPKVAPRSK